MNNSIVTPGFKIPSELKTERFLLRKLSVDDLDKDYEAVMSSVENLKKVFSQNDTWPEGLTTKQDLIDLGWHEKEFQRKSSFAYAVMSLDGSEYLGCVYIYPSAKKDYEVDIFLWVRDSELERGLDNYLFTLVKKWLSEKWPFQKIAYPGRTIKWDDWNSLE